MRALIFILLLLGAGAANSASLTIDFESTAIISATRLEVPQGFSITGDQWQFVRATAPTGCVSPLPTPPNDSDILCVNTSGGIPIADIERLDNTTFGVSSLDVYVRDVEDLSNPGPFITDDILIQGWGSTDNLLAETTVSLSVVGAGWYNLAFDSTWTDISRLRITGQEVTCNCEEFSKLMIDNVAVSTVPIPAAVWLFGSALVVLGWLRRKQTV